YLEKSLREILKVHRVWDMVLVGAGDLGHALANYNGFESRGFRIAAIFDADPQKIGTVMGEWRVQPMEQILQTLREKHIQVAIIAVPATAAQAVADELVE